MKMTNLSILCEWQNLQNRQCVEYYEHLHLGILFGTK